MSDAIVSNEANDEEWILDGVTTSAEADESGFWGMFHELQTKCRAWHTEVPVCLVDLAQ